MTKPKSETYLSPTTTTTTNNKGIMKSGWFLFLLVIPVLTATILYQVDEFDAGSLPKSTLSWKPVKVSKHNDHILAASHIIGEGHLPGPEDLAYDSETGFIYTGCNAGWIRRLKLTTDSESDLKAEDWVYVGVRPLGIAFGPDKQLIVAESGKGLMKVTKEGKVELLTGEAEGLKFRLTDGVDVADDGVIYFTDASSKYSLDDHMLDVLEGRPYGRLMSFDTANSATKVLARDLYFANGVAVSPENDFVVFCETPLRSCSKYYIKGEKMGSVDVFADNLPGYPDNIRYDGEGQYWIGLASGKTLVWDVMLRYPFIRKATAMLSRFVNVPHILKDGGVVAVNLNGEITGLYTDAGLASVTVGIKIGDQLYYGSLVQTYISRLDLTKHAPAERDI
ncbi:hypothetical protein C5167_013879 [Papaver somniferum]|uniref:Strictosidine synthase conserved region domain-containing protein n=1 Tax=Papaver somniferum TaxID=3469 RepID=A0A4Y7J5N0_PAPSO|nr:protein STRICTOSIDINE SYNTHASE-LIKE 6-like [Papaver somniferum]RZC55029.1 hypothetical protein C5167_013879 [Papaver somniferum]